MLAPVLPSPDAGLSWRPISADGIDTWHELVRAIELCDKPAERLDREDLIDELTSGSYKDPTRDSLIGVDGDGVARAFGHVTPAPGPTVRRVFLSGGVHPDWRRRGIGREVLRWQTERAQQAVAEWEASDSTMIGTPWRIAVSHEERLTDRAALYESAGYVAIRWFHDMFRPLGAGAPPSPDVDVPDGLEIALWTEDLDEAVRLAHNEAFAEHWGSQPRDEETWKSWTTQHRTFRRQWSRLVLDPSERDEDGRAEIAGYVVSYAFEQDWEALGHSQGWVGLIGVRPAWRGRKLAPALLANVLRAYAADGMDAAGLDVDTGNATGALSLYKGMGFSVKRTYIMWGLESAEQP
jgi:ribosomal protein S18 acetylase RimI-like enzyme